jgi:nicotinate-nucleotide adenylyltransferase
VNAIAIFGGTFDPVHYGHLRAALEVREQLGIGDFRLLPSGTPPHRATPQASAAHRLAMLQLAAEEHAGFSVDDRELRRPGYSWMVDTLAEIRGEAGNVPLVLLIGQDAANALDSWHEWARLFTLAHLGILRRPDSVASYSQRLASELEGRTSGATGSWRSMPAGCVLELEITQLDISSTAIRQILGSGRSPAFLMPGPVIDYIRRHRLYGC